MNEAAIITAGIAVVGAVVRLIKSDTLTIALANLGIVVSQQTMKRALPWLSLVLGFVYALLVARQLGAEWGDAALTALVQGVVVGGGASYVHDLGRAVPGVSKALAFVFVFSMSTTACTPQGRSIFAEALADKLMCALQNIDLPNEEILKRCAVQPEDAQRVLDLVGESRKTAAKAALQAEEREAARAAEQARIELARERAGCGGYRDGGVSPTP